MKPLYDINDAPSSVAISGNRSAHPEAFVACVQHFTHIGLLVRLPKDADYIIEQEEYVLPQLETSEEIRCNLNKKQIDSANFLYVNNVGGHISRFVASEIAHAIIKRVPVICATYITSYDPDITLVEQKLLNSLITVVQPYQRITELDEADALIHQILDRMPYFMLPEHLAILEFIDQRLTQTQ